MGRRKQAMQDHKNHPGAFKVHRRRVGQTIRQVGFQQNYPTIWALNNERVHKLAVEMENDQYRDSVLWEVYQGV